MSVGVPTITSNVSSIPEVVGDAVLLVDPYNVDKIAVAMERIVGDQDLRAALVERGYERVKQFSWEKHVRQLKEVFRSLAD